MLTKGYTHKVLTEFKKYVIQQARTNLTKGKKNVNSKLYKSLDGDVEVGKTSFKLSFVMEDYGTIPLIVTQLKDHLQNHWRTGLAKEGFSLEMKKASLCLTSL